jgi:homoserine dehydrogenase
MRIAYLGYGTVNRALHALLERHRDAIDFEVIGVASRRGGWMAGDRSARDVREWLELARPDVVFEAIPLDARDGEPSVGYLRAALEFGADVVSANKGPVVFAYRELSTLAARRKRFYRFESAVMDGAPVFSLVRNCLPLAGLRGIRGVFTSTATVVLEAVERGMTIEDGIAEAQRLGIAEADPSYDVDGWDSAVKLCALANVLFEGDLRPDAVDRRGIRTVTEADVRSAAREGRQYRLVGSLRRSDDAGIRAKVEPVQCASNDVFAAVRGTTLVMHYEADVFPGGLTVTSHGPDPTTTAYGMLTDLIAIRAARLR